MGNCPGNLLLPARLTGLSKDSVANVSQIITFDKRLLTEREGKLPARSPNCFHPELMLSLEDEPSVVLEPVCVQPLTYAVEEKITFMKETNSPSSGLAQPVCNNPLIRSN